MNRMDMTPKQIMNAVVDGKRPEWADLDAPILLQKLMKRCWNQNPRKRPSFARMRVSVSD